MSVRVSGQPKLGLCRPILPTEGQTRDNLNETRTLCHAHTKSPAESIKKKKVPTITSDTPSSIFSAFKNNSNQAKSHRGDLTGDPSNVSMQSGRK